jgi:hypothetical protein
LNPIWRRKATGVAPRFALVFLRVRLPLSSGCLAASSARFGSSSRSAVAVGRSGPLWLTGTILKSDIYLMSIKGRIAFIVPLPTPGTDEEETLVA